VDDLQTLGIGQCLEHVGLDSIYLVHVVDCSSYAQVRIGTRVPTPRAERHQLLASAGQRAARGTLGGWCETRALSGWRCRTGAGRDKAGVESRFRSFAIRSGALFESQVRMPGLQPSLQPNL
jgi:hypothetical protein